MLSSSKVFAGVHLIGCRYLALERFCGTIAVSDAGLVALKACKLSSRLMLAYSGAMVVDCFRNISSDKQIYVALISGVWPW